MGVINDITKIDTSYWLTKDKQWVKEREAAWPAIAEMMQYIPKTGLNYIKRYYLRGTMPNWKKLKDWDNSKRHLNLMYFLWLHPSDDPEVLTPLYKLYMESDLVHPDDIWIGYSHFISDNLSNACDGYTDFKQHSFTCMGPKNRILFNIMFNNVDCAYQRIFELYKGHATLYKLADSLPNVVYSRGFASILRMKSWLKQKNMTVIQNNNLLQYPEVLEWIFRDRKNDEILKNLADPEKRVQYERAYYCLHIFDTEAEGDTIRTEFAHRIRKMLDERDYEPEVKQMWQEIRAGKIKFENPWSDDYKKIS